MSSQGSPLGNLVVRVEGDSSPLEESLHKMEGSVTEFVSHVGEATAGLAAAFGLALLGEKAFEAAEKFEQATFTIQRATGATGAQLEGLEETFKKVYATTGQSADAVAGALAQLSIRTGLVGEDLEKLATSNLHLTKVMGGDLKSNIEQSQKLFTQWGVTVEEQPFKLDELVIASQKTGVSFQTLTSEMTASGPILRNMGFSFEESAALLGKFDQSGLGTARVVSALGKEFATLATKFKDPDAALKDLIARIQNAPTPVEALRIAMADGLAKKGAVVLVDAFRLTKDKTDEVVKAMQDGKGTVDDLADKTKSLGDRWKIFQHVLEEALLPLGKPLIEALTDGADKAKAFVKEIQAGVDWFEKLPGPVKIAAAALVALPIGIELAIKGFERLIALKVVTWLTSLGPMVLNVATAIKLDMVGALTSGELWLLRFGQAGLLAAGAFAGWKLGEWLRENIPLMRQFGDAIGDWILKIPGVTRLIDMLNGVDGANKALAQSTDQLNQKLQQHGIILQRVVGESIESWNKKVHDAAVAAGLFAGAIHKTTGEVTTLTPPLTILHPTLQKVTLAFKDMNTEIGKLALAAFKKGVDETGKALFALITAHQLWGKQLELVTADIGQSNDALTLQNDALAQQEASLVNIAAVPLPKWFDDTTNGIYTATDAFKALNISTDEFIQGELDAAAKAYDFIVAMHEVGAASQEELDRATAAYLAAVDKVFGGLDKVTTAGKTMGQQITQVIGKDLTKAITDIIFQTGKIGDAFVKLGKDVVDIVVNHIIGQAIKPLLSALDSVLAKIPGIGGVFGGGGSSGGGSVGGGGDPTGGSGGAIGGALMGGLAGWVGVGISAISGIVQGFQMAHEIDLLKLIEQSTRYAWLSLGSGDASIASWTHQTVMTLQPMQTTLWEMRGDNAQIIDNLQQILAQIKTVAKMSLSVAGGGSNASVNFHPGSIVVQGSDDPMAVAENVARAIPRLMKSRSAAFITQPAF